MLSERLRLGDVIGVASPSHIATPESYASIFRAIEEMGFRVKAADNLFSCAWGYAASAEARAADLNQLIRNPDVRMIFFGGGEGADDVLPLIDYEAAQENPKLWLSYSDGTSILNTVHSRTGLTTYYGQSVGMLSGMSEYNRANFGAHIMSFSGEFLHSELPWRTITPGVSEGTLVGGYLDNFIHLLGCGWIKPEPGRKYILFIEDNERFFGVEHESVLLTRLEQSRIMPQVSGLLFGHYSMPANEHLMERLARLGRKWSIPVAYCDDFGHGAFNAILPIGAQARLDTQSLTLDYRYE